MHGKQLRSATDAIADSAAAAFTVLVVVVVAASTAATASTAAAAAAAAAVHCTSVIVNRFVMSRLVGRHLIVNSLDQRRREARYGRF